MPLEKAIENVSNLLQSNRRGLMRGAGISAATLSAIAMGLPATAEAQEAAAAVTDVDVLNFALNLEYLEAEFYLHAVYGTGLPSSLTTGPGGSPGGTVTGGSQVTFKDAYVRELAAEVAQDEYLHVQFLRKALGSAAVAEPDINIGTAFAALGTAAGIPGTFNPYANENSFLLGGYVFEDVGVTAYHGAAHLISNKAYLTAAAGILAVEAYHAAEFRLQIYQKGLSGPAGKIAHLRAALSGVADDQGTVLMGKPNIVPTDVNGLAFRRNTTQVLNIVYGGGSGSDYLFFPSMLNGTIK